MVFAIPTTKTDVYKEPTPPPTAYPQLLLLYWKSVWFIYCLETFHPTLKKVASPTGIRTSLLSGENGFLIVYLLKNSEFVQFVFLLVSLAPTKLSAFSHLVCVKCLCNCLLSVCYRSLFESLLFHLYKQNFILKFFSLTLVDMLKELLQKAQTSVFGIIPKNLMALRHRLNYLFFSLERNIFKCLFICTCFFFFSCTRNLMEIFFVCYVG